MYDIILNHLSSRKKPLEIIVVGLGFMGFGFISSIRSIEGIKVPLLITRRPKESLKFLKSKGLKVKAEDNSDKIRRFAKIGYLCVSDDLDLLKKYDNEVVLEMTGDVYYGTEVALRTIAGGKHLVTMNPELQATVGTQLKKIADKKGVIITDVVGDQPGSLSRMISRAKLMGFRVLVAGNMKRYLDVNATQKMMQNWADEYGLSVRQTTSFTDGTKQAIEMNLVANYFGMKIIKDGMVGLKVENVQEALQIFNQQTIPKVGVVDYVIGMKLFPGVFLVVEHKDKNQARYLRYLKMGNGPRYVLFEPYHLCHLEVLVTLVETVLSHQATINNSLNPTTRTVAVTKFNLRKGQVLDGIGGDTVYGKIVLESHGKKLLPVGLTEGAILKRDINQGKSIKINDVNIVKNSATKLVGLK